MIMKTINILTFLFLIIGGCNLYANKDRKDGSITMELPKIQICDPKIDSLLNIIVLKNSDYLEQGCYILMGLLKESDGSRYINIMIYEKEKFKITCPQNDYPILGYFVFNNQIVLVVGEYQFSGMNFLLNKKKYFTFQCRKTGKEYPPSMYNPPNYLFLYKE